MGFDSERWGTPRQSEYKLGDSITIVYIGYLESQFDLTDIIRCVLLNEKIKLTVVGDGSKLKQYQYLASGCDRVSFTGYLSPSEAVAVLSEADIGVLPIKFSAQMPNKLFDYLGANLPILCIGFTDSSIFVTSNGLGWVVDFCYDEMVEFFCGLSGENILAKKEKSLKFVSNIRKK